MRPRLAVVPIFLAVATPALAAGVFPIGGVYGNEAGCRLYATGISSAGFKVLTSDTYSSESIGCDFESLASAEKAVFTAKAICSPGGAQTVQVLDHGAAGYGVVVGTGAEVGPLPACPALKVPGEPSGVVL